MKATRFVVESLGESHIPPMWCVGCPFGTAKDDVNPSDPSEGSYQCELLDKVVWGEDPECGIHHWAGKMKKELGFEW